ncbi:MAG: glycosyltransferase family 2 protein [Nitrospiraceae bacterium]|nr:glycosyltransferase family 2 protein [Nitrospiraceae bacterium]
MNLSAYIIAYNEAKKISDAINSVLWADEIIVADSASTDETAQIATDLGARVVQIPFHGFGHLRNQAIKACTHEWIFSLDTDEQCTPEVRDEILRLFAETPEYDAYLVPRRNYFMGQWVAHSGWYPNFRQPQLFRKSAMQYMELPVHEGYELLTAKPVGRLEHAIWQIPFRNFEEVVKKANRYSTLGAQKLDGKRVSMGTAVLHGIWSFLKHYVAKRGFLDGWVGFVIAFGNFEGTFYRYAKRFEQQEQWPIPKQPPLRRPKSSSPE